MCNRWSLPRRACRNNNQPIKFSSFDDLFSKIDMSAMNRIKCPAEYCYFNIARLLIFIKPHHEVEQEHQRSESKETEKDWMSWEFSPLFAQHLNRKPHHDAILTRQIEPFSSNVTNCASLMMRTPSSSAFCAFDPGESPTTT